MSYQSVGQLNTKFTPTLTYKPIPVPGPKAVTNKPVDVSAAFQNKAPSKLSFVPSALAGAITRVGKDIGVGTARTAKAVVRPVVDAATLKGGKAVHDVAQLGRDSGASPNYLLNAAIANPTKQLAASVSGNKTAAKNAQTKTFENLGLGDKGDMIKHGALKFGVEGASVLPVGKAAGIVGREVGATLKEGKLGEALTKARAPLAAPRSALDKHIVEDTTQATKTAPAASKSLTRADAAVESNSASIEKPLGTVKNPNIPTAENITAIPKDSKVTKNLISVSGDLSRQGKSGQEIADRLGKAESASETGQAGFLKKIPTVTKLKSKEFPQFVDTLDALDKGKTPEITNPKIQQAVDEWTKAIPEVRSRAEAAGVEVGDLGPHYFPRNYTEALSTPKGLTQAAQHLVKTGQAKTFGEAVRDLRNMKNEYNTPFGHFEKSRTVDLPNYDKTKNALVNYVGGAYNKIGHAEQFGPKGEVADTLVGNIAAEGRDADRALKNYQIATGQYKYHTGPTSTNALEKVRGFNRVTKLGLSSILNATQSVNTASEAGIIRTGKRALQTLSHTLPKADKDYIESTGVRVESVINALREQTGAASKIGEGGNFVKKVLGKTLNAPGFGQVEKFNRGVAAVAGRDYARALAKRGSPRAIRVLRDKLGIEGEIGRTLTPEQEIQAGRKIVDLTQFKTGAKDLPGWADSPQGKTVAQFRTFSYKQTGFVYNQLLKEAIKNHNPVPLMRFLAVGVPVGIAAGGARNELGGKPFYGTGTAGQSNLKKLLGATLQGSSNVGGTGLAGNLGFLYENRKSPNELSYAAGDVGGPTVGLGANALQAYSQGKKGEERFALGQVPVAGPVLKSKLTPYTPSQNDSLVKAIGSAKGVSDTLKSAGYTPGQPQTKQRNVQLSDKQYQQFLDQSNSVFVSKVKKAESDPSFQKLSTTNKQKTLAKALTDAHSQTLDKMLGKKPKVKKTISKIKAY